MPNDLTRSVDFDAEAFVRWIAEYPRGLLGIELSEAMAACVQATQLYDKSSTFTLKVTGAPGNPGMGDRLVKAGVASKPAKPTNPTMTFFPTPDGGLSRRDPNQSQLPGTETT